jgi:hypothetical protein
MFRVRLFALAFVLTVLTGLSAGAADWATVKGQVTFPANKDIPKREPLNVTQDKDHCLSKGQILDESIVVDPKTRGVKNVVVWLRPDDKSPTAKFSKDQIHPDGVKPKSVEHVITQPCCMFTERVTAARVGDTIVVKNPAPVPHNFFWSSANNGEENKTIPKNEEYKLPNPLVAEGPPIQYKCTIHGWMTGYVRIFDHPYFAVTDAEGKFEIKNAPVGKYRIVYWHENGFKGGAQGRFGEEIEIKGPTTEVKTEFDVSPKKN